MCEKIRVRAVERDDEFQIDKWINGEVGEVQKIKSTSFRGDVVSINKDGTNNADSTNGTKSEEKLSQ